MSIPDEIIVIKGILRFSWRQSKVGTGKHSH